MLTVASQPVVGKSISLNQFTSRAITEGIYHPETNKNTIEEPERFSQADVRL